MDEQLGRIDEKLNKLEFMLVGLRQMNLTSVCTYFVGERRETIINAIKNSPKFKIEGDIVSLKSDSERYEEELQRDILKDLIGEEDNTLLDDLSEFDDDLELQENILDDTDIFEVAQPVVAADVKEVQPVEASTQHIEPVDVEVKDWNDVEEVFNAPLEVSPIEEIPEVKEASKVEEPQVKVAEPEVKVAAPEVNIEEQVKVEQPQVNFEQYQQKVNLAKADVKNQPASIDNIKGSDLSYEEILRLVDEYNESVEKQLNYSVKNRYEVREKAIKSFYENKYIVKLKEKALLDTKTNIYSLINKKKGIEAAYLLICDTLTEPILNFMLDNYDDEVVYFCPIEDVRVNFEVGLNEFYLKDTDIIFDKYLEHYEIVEEADRSIRKLEVIIGSN